MGETMASNKDTNQSLSGNQPVGTIVPKGELVHLRVDQIKPSANNPRRLFDPAPLSELKESIKTHGVLVPLTVYKLAGQSKYAIVDGERRFRCCADLIKEGINIQIPANIVETPDKMASLIYMFNIHSFREQWELMPTALSLKEVMKELKTEDTNELHEITGLSVPQIERCKKILSFPKEFQDMSLEEDPSERIPSNFWIELYPVLEKTKELLPELYPSPGRRGITLALVEKYRAKKIKSVIHFRRIMEAIDTAESDNQKKAVSLRIKDYILTPELETRNAFDEFIQDARKVQRATGICEKFISDMDKAKIDYAIEGKEEIIEMLNHLSLE
jgi:ParB family transcriptional regulator, chromosome partitioning protein